MLICQGTCINMYRDYYSNVFKKDKNMKVILSKNKKELVSKLWSVSETNSTYTSNNIYYHFYYRNKI